MIKYKPIPKKVWEVLSDSQKIAVKLHLKRNIKKARNAKKENMMMSILSGLRKKTRFKRKMW